MDLAGLIEADGGGVEDEVAGRDGHGGGAVSAGDVQGQGAGMRDAAVEHGAAGEAVGGVQSRDDRVERHVNQAGRRPHDAAVADRGIDFNLRALVDGQVERIDPGGRAARGEDTVAGRGTDGLSREVSGEEQATRTEVQRVEVVREGEGLISGAGRPGDGVRVVGAGHAGAADIGHDEGCTLQTVVFGGHPGGGESRGGITRIADAVYSGKATRRVTGDRRDVTDEVVAGRHPRDDVIDEEGGAIAGEEARTAAAHLAGGRAQEDGGVVVPGDGSERQYRRFNRAAAEGYGQIGLALIEDEVSQGFRGCGVVAAGEADGPALGGNGRGRDAVSEVDGTGVGDGKGTVVDADRPRTGETTLVGDGQGTARDERATGVGVVGTNREGAIASLIEKDVAGDLAAPFGGIAHHDDQCRCRAGSDCPAASDKGDAAGSVETADHLSGAIEIERGSLPDG